MSELELANVVYHEGPGGTRLVWIDAVDRERFEREGRLKPVEGPSEVKPKRARKSV